MPRPTTPFAEPVHTFAEHDTPGNRGWVFACLRHTLFLVLALSFASRFFPLLNPGTHCMTSGDPALMCWTLQWVSHALVHDPLHLFQGNIFYPYAHSVVLTDAMVSLGVINAPVRLFTDNPWVGYNLLIVLAYYLSALSGAWLAREVTGSRLAGLWGGIFWGFLFYRVHQIGHLQILSFQGIPAAIVCLVRWWRQPDLKRTLLLAVVVVAQALVSWYLAVVLGLVLLVVAAARPSPARLTSRHARHAVLAIALVVLAVLPVAWPYARAFDDSSLGDRRNLVATFGDAVKPADYLTPPAATLVGHLLPGNPYWIWQENTLFIGFVAIALAAGSVFALRRAAHRRWLAAGILLVGVGYVFALGFVSARHHIRLPLHFLAEWLPFLAGLRATQRFSLVLYAGVLILSSLGLHAWLTRTRSRAARAGLTVALCTLFLVEVFPLHLPFSPGAPWSFSQPDRAIAGYQRGLGRRLVVLHLPIYYFVQSYPIAEATYMVNSTAHWAFILNGFSGAEPMGFLDRMRVLNDLPSEASVAELRRVGVDAIAVHAAESWDRRQQLAAYFGAQPWARIIHLPGDEFIVLLGR